MPLVRPKSRANIGVILGALALAVSPFMAWVHVFLFGSLSLFELTSLSNDNSGWFPVTIVLLGIVVAALGTTRARGNYAVTLVIGAIGGAIGVLVFIELVHGISERDGFVTIGYGPYVGLLGLLVILISSIVGVVVEGR